MIFGNQLLFQIHRKSFLWRVYSVNAEYFSPGLAITNMNYGTTNY